MIGRICGTLAAKQPPQVLVDVNGVGYEIDVPMSTFYNLPAIGEKVSLLTHLAIREDAHLLYGFGSETERAAFRELLKVSGIGAKTALSVLSGLSVNDLAAAIAAQEIGRIVKVPGIGKKTAERLLLELKGKPVFAGAISAVAGESSVSDDVRQALLALGYNDKETGLAMQKLPADLPVSDAIRQALKLLSKG
ncbi:MAG: Holliday junction branch migration protein RuvA [Gammaproteobacteria bacterium]|jgi:Holliday junction DNA helicase RuvA|nr:Holliday junction branch migration protein RuvA [Gammaproteobacteria bacterium]MBU1409026.1 Holliday junction branch migration protein RuvA [Gammaproteobacteria bacterium]MBU1533553.1 Holliday junction branch migration protein RuvA [Gammaproteobacteria bacterium]